MISVPPRLETARLCLREHRLTDKADHVAMWADPRVTRFIGGTPREGEVSWGRFLGGAGLWPVMGYGYWVFTDRQADRLIGMGGLAYFARNMPELEGAPEAGWALSPDHWGRGLATEAMQAVLCWSDEHLDVDDVRAILDTDHSLSRRTAEKLGFVKYAQSVHSGAPVDVYRRPRGG